MLAIRKRWYLFGEDLILVESVLDALHTYTMSLFPIPKMVEKRIDKLGYECLWQGDMDKKSFNLFYWKRATNGKKEGSWKLEI